MTKVKVFAGACGFTSVVKVQALDGRRVEVQIVTACTMARSLNEELGVIEWKKGVFNKFCDSTIYQAAHRKLKHTDCPVPVAVIKAIQAEIGGAVPKDVIIRFEGND